MDLLVNQHKRGLSGVGIKEGNWPNAILIQPIQIGTVT